MERIKVEIKQLGRVRDSVIETAPLMVFSGESGMGKSYLALLSHYFFDVLMLSEQTHRLVSFFEDAGYDYKEMVESFHGVGEAFTITKRQVEEWMAKDAIEYLRFMLNSSSLEGDIRITLPNAISDEMPVRYQEGVAGLVDREDKGVVLYMGKLGYRVSHSAINDMSPFAYVLSAYLTECLFGDMRAMRHTFNMPPSRGPVLSENVIANSGIYKDFIADISELSNVQAAPRMVSETLLNQLHAIMEGEVKKENNKFVYYADGTPIPVSAAASSIREIAPLQMFARKIDASSSAVLIEEPEAHLHPSKQRMMADIVGCLYKAGAYVHLTTHSDYFLRRMNELILFQRYADSHSDAETAALSEKTGIRQSFSVREGDVVGYLVERQADGTSRVVAQNIKHGIPFTSFSDAVRESMRIGDILEDALEA